MFIGFSLDALGGDYNFLSEFGLLLILKLQKKVAI